MSSGDRWARWWRMIGEGDIVLPRLRGEGRGSSKDEGRGQRAETESTEDIDRG
jgi:hypothetical protein